MDDVDADFISGRFIGPGFFQGAFESL